MAWTPYFTPSLRTEAEVERKVEARLTERAGNIISSTILLAGKFEILSSQSSSGVTLP